CRAPVGQPGLGPVAYMHRPSAAYDPVAPLGHHAQDFTHISDGVATLGVFTRRFKVEGSVFNGAHPDEVRTDLDPVRLDAYGGRLSFNPSAGSSLTAWFGHIPARDRKSTRLNSSHGSISYAVFCLKKKKHISSNVNCRRSRHTSATLQYHTQTPTTIVPPQHRKHTKRY